jgi:hypothetical protein
MIGGGSVCFIHSYCIGFNIYTHLCVFCFVGLGVKVVDGWEKFSESEWHAVGGN